MNDLKITLQNQNEKTDINISTRNEILNKEKIVIAIINTVFSPNNNQRTPFGSKIFVRHLEGSANFL